MSQSYLDQPRRANRDWPEIRFPDRNAPLNRIYYDAETVDADNLRKFPKEVEKADAGGYTVTANTAGALHNEYFIISDDVGEGWVIRIDGNSSHALTPIATNEIICRIAVGASAATVASEIAKRIQQLGGQWMALSSGARLYVYTHKLANAFSNVPIVGWSSFSAVETVTFLRHHMPKGLVIGSRHPQFNYLILTDCWLSSSTDKQSTFSRVWQVDLPRLALAYPTIDIESLLLGGGMRTTLYPYAHRDSPEISWTFTLVNPEAYVRPPQLTPMPGEPDALLISEQQQREGQSVSVTRTYKRIAALTQQYKLSFTQDTETGDTGSKTVVWSYDTFAADYNPPAVGTACPIDNGGISDSLDFTGLVVIKAPTYTATTADLGRATVVYGKLTGTELAGISYETPFAVPPDQFLRSKKVENSTQIVPIGTSPDTSGTVITSVVTPMDAVRSRINTSAILNYDGTPLYSWVVDQETGIGSTVTEQAVAAGTPGTDVAADGTFSEVTPVNAYWSIKTTRKSTTLPSYTNAVSYTKTERSPMVWPAILGAVTQTSLLHQSEDYYVKKVDYDWIPQYTGDVQIEYREWWQKDVPAPVSPVEMIDTPIRIDTMWKGTISIESCLHSEFLYEEPVIVSWIHHPELVPPLTTGHKVRKYRVPPTNVTEWAAVVPKLEIQKRNGGFHCLLRNVYRPVNYAVESTQITYREWTINDTAYYAP